MVDTAACLLWTAGMKWLAAAVLLVALAAPAHAGWDEAVAALDRGDHEAAIGQFAALAAAGNAMAAGEIAQIRGRPGPARNLVRAYMWYEISIRLLPPQLREHETDIIGLAQAALADDMTSTQIAEAERLAKAWWDAHRR
jgi:hypothetical protein